MGISPAYSQDLFDPLSNGSGLVAAVFVCVKRGHYLIFNNRCEG